MNTAMVLTLLAVFLASAMIVLAIGLVWRDLHGSDEQVQRRLGNGLPKIEGPPTEMLVRESTGWLDRKFYALLEGADSRLSAPTALTLLLGAAVVGCVLGLVLLENPLAGIPGLLLGVALPLSWWAFQRARRFKKMRAELPGALELLADSLQAGQTLEQAAEMVALQISSPLREEFGYCVSLLRLGYSPVGVMERMARRIPLPEFRVFAVAVVVHRQTGGNLAALAARLAASARDRQEFLGQLGAQTVSGRYSAIGLVICTMIGVGYLASERPEYLQFFFQHELGPALLAAAAVFLLVGIVWMWRIMKVQY